jgi:hypothetical protein
MFETPVAKTAGILSALLVLGITVSIGVKSIGFAILALILMTPGYLLSVFDINCTAAGECHIWSWIKTVFLVVSYVMILVIAVTASAAAKKTVAAAEPAAPAATTTAPATTTTTAPATTTTTTTA